MTAYPNAVESKPDAAEALNEAADVMADLIAALKLCLPFVDFDFYYRRAEMTAAEIDALEVARKTMLAALAKAAGK